MQRIVDYCHEKLNVLVASYEFTKDLRLRKLRTFKKISKLPGIKNEFLDDYLKQKTLTIARKNCKKSAIKL